MGVDFLIDSNRVGYTYTCGLFCKTFPHLRTKTTNSFQVLESIFFPHKKVLKLSTELHKTAGMVQRERIGTVRFLFNS